jgi:DNA primase catalytic core
MIPESLVDEIRERADIVELIGEHVPLKRAGKDYRALCPFHTEKTPSFYVVPSKGFFKCFGCGESGDLFDFLMRRLGLDFPETVRLVAARVGVEVPDVGGRDAASEAHRAVYEALGFAEDFYRQQLGTAVGERARQYLIRRELDDEVTARFGLGYAPDGWHVLGEAAAAHGIEESVLLEAGLIKDSARGGERYDRLRDRLVFPIKDVSGRTIAFGGRILGQARPGAPKYLNSPETPVYHKGRVLYGLNWSRHAIRREEAALVVEGYMDYISLAARGFENAVAPLGTALTEEQATLLGRYTKRALLLYDSDAAGLRATFRSADALLAVGVHPLVVTLPDGEDPDSLVRGAEGPKRMKQALDAGVDVLERKMQILEDRGYFDDIEGTRRALDGLLPTVRAVLDPALRDLYIDRVSRRTGVRRETLEAELNKEQPGGWERSARPGGGATAARAPEPGAEPPGLAGQRKLVMLLLRDRPMVPEAAARLEPDDFTDPVFREIFLALRSAQAAVPAVPDAGASGGVESAEAAGDESPVRVGVGPTAAPLALSDRAQARVAELAADVEELSNASRMLEDLVNDLRSERLYRRLQELDRQLPLAESRGDDMLTRELAREKKTLAMELRRIGRPLEWRFRKHVRGDASRSRRHGIGPTP